MEQKENIAALAIGQAKVRFFYCDDVGDDDDSDDDDDDGDDDDDDDDDDDGDGRMTFLHLQTFTCVNISSLSQRDI